MSRRSPFMPRILRLVLSLGRVANSTAGGWPGNPIIHEVNTWAWLSEVGERLGRAVGLGDLSDEHWDEIVLPGVDAVWFMGVWARSDEGRRIAEENPQIRSACDAVLPDRSPGDFVSSAYCIQEYRVDDRIGGHAGLAAARQALRRRGVRLILDYVPNHVAPDHAWTKQHPEYFVTSTRDAAQADPEGWIEIGGNYLARGRDPYFPPWPEVVQLDAFDPGLRAAAAATLASIAEQCDGVRCDMAMLMLDDVFASTWGGHVGPPLERPYWLDVAEMARNVNPDFLLMAEVYWGREGDVLAQGFDYVYDKVLYDRLVECDVEGVRAHLGADASYQSHLVRFLENHDEPRAATVFPAEPERASLVLSAAVPGALLLHEGQLDGRRVRLPVFLTRRPGEALDGELHAFSEDVLRALAPFRRGGWSLCPTSGWDDNQSHRQLVAASWSTTERACLVVVNLSPSVADGNVAVPWPNLAGRRLALVDLLSGGEFERDGDDLAGNGLYVRLEPWQFHVLAWDATSSGANISRTAR
jgi:hypothetical protein